MVSKLKTQTPSGVRDFLPQEIALRGKLINRARNLFEKKGYQRVITPTFELYDTLAKGTPPTLLEQAFKFFDRTGRMMILRPDMTTPIARMVATQFKKSSKNFKFYYTDRVYRQQRLQVGKEQELYQMGIENIGKKSVEVDAEVISLAAELIRELGVKSYFIDVGDSELINGIIADLKLDETTSKEFLQALKEQNYVDYERVVKNLKISAKNKDKLLRLPRLRGKADVLPEAAKLFKGRKAQKAIADLRKLFKLLKAKKVAERIIFDLGMVRDYEYYTGIVFECFSPGLGCILGSGGRYDNLLKAFGKDMPATGFALNLERILLALGR